VAIGNFFAKQKSSVADSDPYDFVPPGSSSKCHGLAKLQKSIFFVFDITKLLKPGIIYQLK
jgi:hypothetical protein